jgi:hypothetical protein
MSKVITHNGVFTFRNPKTGGHRTFQVKCQPKDSNFAPGQRVVSLLVGPDREFQQFGFVTDRVHLWKKYRDSPNFTFYAKMLVEPKDMEVLAEVSCRVCNRPLTTPESILSGIGPICASN